MAIAFPVTIPFADSLGITLLGMADGTASVGCAAEERLCNSYGMPHGGLVMSLLDLAMVHAARSPRPGEPPPPMRCVTIGLTTSFLRAGPGPLVARAQVISRTRSLAFCEATVFDRDEQILARASATFRMVEEQ